MTNTEQLAESLERLQQMRFAFKSGDVSAFGMDGLIAELLKVLRILIEERPAYAVDKAASEIPALKQFSTKRDAKRKDEGRTSREPVNGSSPKR